MRDAKRDNLAEAMGFSNAMFGDTAMSFFDMFERSGWMERFERGDGRATLGCSGAELALNVRAQLGDVRQAAEFRDRCGYFVVTRPIEYWIGYALGYLQARSGFPFSALFEHFPLESWYGMYILHEVGDETLWDKTLGRYCSSG
jgi:hypothetical protein